jgi:hypothetical protein
MLNPEKRNIIDKGIELVKNDADPSPKGDHLEAAKRFVAEEVLDMEDKLAAEYDASVEKVMELSNKDKGVDKAFYDVLMRDKEAYIATAISRVMNDKARTIADAPAELKRMLKAASETN